LWWISESATTGRRTKSEGAVTHRYALKAKKNGMTVRGSHFGSRQRYQNQGWALTIDELSRSIRVNLANSIRLENGRPQVARSQQPTKRSTEMAKPAPTARSWRTRCFSGSGRIKTRVASGTRKTISLNRRAKAAPTAAPATSG
jgi:hypothetical protein